MAPFIWVTKLGKTKQYIVWDTFTHGKIIKKSIE